MRRTGDRRHHKRRIRPLIRRIAGWLGADGNPMRRRTDRIESVARMLLVLAFLVGAPLLGSIVGSATYSAGLREIQAERAWHQVDATLLRSAPQVVAAYGAISTFWVPGRWQSPTGAMKVGMVPTSAGVVAGTSVPIWVNGAGRISDHQPITTGSVVFRTVMAEIATLIGLAATLIGLGVIVRCLLNRRRLTNWAIEWALVGPRWTSRR